MVRLETELALERGLCNTLNTALSNESGTLELSLDEELAVHDEGSRIERSVRDRGVDVVLCGNRVSNQEPGALELVKLSCVVEASQDLVDGVCANSK